MANGKLTKKEIEGIVWRACDTFRGAIDPSEYKNYILTMLFVKYLSDVSKDKREEYMRRYGGDAQRVERAMSREPFVVAGMRFRPPVRPARRQQHRRVDQRRVGEDRGTENKSKLENVFRNIDFNSERPSGRPRSATGG
jgi:type I restriction enzyme M protein